ncbi:diguanylate cyclase [Candidatus Fermentibacterales bacterium]|nr:diguanylate cyclase [Candidatus Fermentibacterales bacterium]
MQEDTPRDELTGLPGREALESLGGDFLARDQGTRWSVMVVDIDHFKLINDVYGHLCGDDVLKQIGAVIQRNARRGDTAIRFGDDEFIVVMPGTDHLQAANAAQRVLEELREESFPNNLEVSLSLGVADSSDSDQALSSVVERADRALYQAKEGGRGRVSFYSESPGESQGFPAGISFDHFVDRQRELKVLRTALDETILHGGRTVVISGSPGTGKTRLGHELMHYCRFKGCYFLEARCEELGSRKPYTLLTRPIAHRLSEFEDRLLDRLREEIGEVDARTSSLFPALGLTGSIVQADDPESTRFRVMSEIARVLGAMTSISPTVLMVDDIQWMSRADLELFCQLARSLRESPVLLLATLRSPTRDYPLVESQLHSLSRFARISELELRDLEAEYAGHMVMFALRDPQVPRQVLSVLIRQSGGNPLYLREILRSLHESGAICRGEDGSWRYRLEEGPAVPDSLSGVIEGRLDKLEGDGREVVRAAAHAVGCFTLELIAAVTDRLEPDIERSFEKPLQMDLLREEPGPGESSSYCFHHDTLREFLLRETTPEDHVSINGRIARFYEARLDDEGDSELLHRIAFHYGESGDEPRLSRFALLTARACLDDQARLEALPWLERFLETADRTKTDRSDLFFAALELGRLYTLTGRDSEGQVLVKELMRVAADEEEVGRVHLLSGQLLFNQGDMKLAMGQLNNALDRLIDLSERAAAVRLLAMVLFSMGRGDQGIELLSRCIREVENSDVGGRSHILAHLHNALGGILASVGHSPAGAEHCLEAVSLFSEAGDRAGEAAASMSAASALDYELDWEKRLSLMKSAVGTFREMGLVDSLMPAYVSMARLYNLIGQYDLTEEYASLARSLAEDTGARDDLMWAEAYLGFAASGKGDPGSAESHFGTAIRLAVECGSPSLASRFRLDLAEFYIDRNQLDRAEELVAEVEKTKGLDQMGDKLANSLSWARGRLFLAGAMGDRDKLGKAEELLRARRDSHQMFGFVEDMETAYVLARCLLQKGKISEAAELVREAFAKLQECLENFRSSTLRNSFSRTELASGLTRLHDSLLGRSTSD